MGFLDEELNLDFDINLETERGDVIDAKTINAGNYKILLNNINALNSSSEDRVSIHIASDNLKDYIMFSPKMNITYQEGTTRFPNYFTYNSELGNLDLAYAYKLADAVADTVAQRLYTMSETETVDTNLGRMGGDDSNLIVTANGYSIVAGATGLEGINVVAGQILDLSDANGEADSSDGFTGFGNDNRNGGAIRNYGTLNVDNSKFTSNTGKNGGAISNSGVANITDTDFVNNTATSGGAIYNNSASTVNINAENRNVTFTGNTASENSNAIYNAGTVNFAIADNKKVVMNDGINGSNGVINVNGSQFGEFDLNSTISNSWSKKSLE